MKKTALPLGIIVMALGLSACDASVTDEREGPNAEEQSSNDNNQERDEAEMANLLALELQIGDEVFSAQLYESETTEALLELLPLTIDMEDLHGNEKFFHLSERLPTSSESPRDINAGDIMLYGDNCLVFFYDKLSTSHQYTRLGYIEDVERFTQAVGERDVTVALDFARNDR
ncbi:cyclophilin-like fold protein [Planococcus maritimus]|nr:cyclophilin-like fold protein [Planococcus sp. SK3692]MDE4085202.1 cyclophilin-like fold protein [Planococcus maritimus]